MRDASKVLPWVLLVGLSGGGCGPNDLEGTANVAVEDEGAGRPIDYVPVMRTGQASPMEVALAELGAPGGPPQVVYLNRDGAVLTGGDDDASQNRSSVVRSRATIPRFRGSDATWTRIRDCVRDEFARFNVTVTDVRPADGPYVMAMFGGNGSEVGYGRGVGGVAPIDTYSCGIIDRAVAFIFTDNLGINNAETICEVGAHEVGHTLTLDHELLAADPMTYLSYNGLQTFQDQDASCGEYAARSCPCRRVRQNSVQVLAQKLGWRSGDPPPPPPPGKAPEVSILRPADGDTLPAQSTIQIVARATDDEAVSKVELLWKYNGATFSCPGSYCTQSGDTYTFSLNVGSGERRFQVRATDRSGLTTTTPERVIQLKPMGGDTLSLRVLEPMEGQQVRAGGTVRLRVDVQASQPLDHVAMTWSGAYGSLTNALSPEGGTIWALDIRISSRAPAGPRQITVFAEDVAGNRATAPPVRLNLVE